MNAVREISVKAIVVRERLRPLSDATVAEIAESMSRVGLLNPISVHQPNVSPVLVAGHHRLAAARKLGWETIRCCILPSDMTDDDLRLSEIDENLARGDLSDAERAIHVSERKAIYERQRPETKHGAVGNGRGKKSRQVGDSTSDRFTADTAAKTGQSERKIQRDATRSKRIERLHDVVGTSLDKGDELDALAKLPADKQDEIITRAAAGEKVSAKTEAKKVRRAEIEQQTAAKITALPTKKYGVIYADPEWRFEAFSEETTSHGPQDHYKVSETDEIAKRDVASICYKDCVLFLWATVPMLPDALRVMEAWGFTYKSHLAWIKNRAGTGYWARNKHELLLIGTKGKPAAPAPGDNPDSAIHADVGAHSAKPEVFAELIERLYPNTPKIELNRRGPARPGWDAWGAEAAEVAA